MIYLAVLTTIIAVCVAHIEWRDFRVGNTRLPTTSEEAEAQGWSLFEKEADLGVKWWAMGQDRSLSLGFDGQDNVAAVRVSIARDDIVGKFKDTYENSEYFEEDTIDGRIVYSATLLLTDKRVLRAGGRRKLHFDEVALSLKVKRSGRYEDILSNGCEQYKRSGVAETGAFSEQGCENEYGLVMSAAGPGFGCDSLSPFYLVFDPRATGQLTGVGWLALVDPQTTSPFQDVLSQYSLRKRFLHAPSCLWGLSPGTVTTVDLWFSRQDSLQASCPFLESWVEDRCVDSVLKSIGETS